MVNKNNAHAHAQLQNETFQFRQAFSQKYFINRKISYPWNCSNLKSAQHDLGGSSLQRKLFAVILWGHTLSVL